MGQGLWRGGGGDLEQPADELLDLVAQLRRGRECEFAAGDVGVRDRLEALEIGAGQGVYRGWGRVGAGGGGASGGREWRVLDEGWRVIRGWFEGDSRVI